MREKPLNKIGEELARLRHELAPEHRSRPAGFGIDGGLVNGLLAGELARPQEAELAGQVARLLPFHYVQTNTYASIMSQVTDHLGGQQKLMEWMDGFAGLPRLTARLYVLMGLLDTYSENHAVVTALREFRERTPYPAGLKEYLLPETDDETIAALASRIEHLLGDGETYRSVRLALATADCLRQIAPQAARLDPGAEDLGELMDHCHQDIEEAFETTPA